MAERLQDAAEGTGWAGSLLYEFGWDVQGQDRVQQGPNSWAHCKKKLLPSQRSEVQALTTISVLFACQPLPVGPESPQGLFRRWVWGEEWEIIALNNPAHKWASGSLHTPA